MKHVSKELNKRAHKAIKTGRRRDAKCDRRTLQRNLKDIARSPKFDGVAIVSEEGRVL